VLVQFALESIEEKKRILVHCMAGIGRTGTFGAVLEGLRVVNQQKTYSLA
jgi:protein-tyrosine phosphatase